ncbi:class II fumarate hydratase [Litorivivens sp.]|uniref:class II fumarate hydratase n=1 Tax=Litorivivens sp. TaxID=2020868 RepID=UPI0035692F9D
MTEKTRIEKDSLGEVKVPANALYGAQTQRAVENFPISGQPLPWAFLQAVIQIKRCAAKANARIGSLDRDTAEAIVEACDELLGGGYEQQFPVDVYQTGSGTSTNMNVNEVVAALATNALGREVSANDDVNCSQSSNDVIPTAIHVSAYIELDSLLNSLDALKSGIVARARECHHHVKTGRTHLMDAMPVRLSQELLAWSDQLEHCHTRLTERRQDLLRLAQGGTAVGSGVNADAEFAPAFVRELSELTAVDWLSPVRKFALIASQDNAVALSGELKTLAVSLTKIANDLRWMNSGPLSGLGEIQLPVLQPGSSIMPGKVNPVIPESALMVAASVVGNDTTITLAGQSGNFQLNVMLPVIAAKLLESIHLLTTTCSNLNSKAIAGFTVNEQALTASLARNPVLVTALNPVIGYMKAAAIAKRAYAEQRPVIDVAQEMTSLSRAELESILDPAKLTGE